MHLTLNVWEGSGQVKKIASLKLYVIHLKFRLLSEMVAKDYLVSFLCGNTALGFCDLINKYKQISAFFFFFFQSGW